MSSSSIPSSPWPFTSRQLTHSANVTETLHPVPRVCLPKILMPTPLPAHRPLLNATTTTTSHSTALTGLPASTLASWQFAFHTVARAIFSSVYIITSPTSFLKYFLAPHYFRIKTKALHVNHRLYMFCPSWVSSLSFTISSLFTFHNFFSLFWYLWFFII